jgi:hypothetical protein
MLKRDDEADVEMTHSKPRKSIPNKEIKTS